MTTRGARAVIAGLATAAIAAAGCGGGGPSEEEFTEQANAVCKRHYGEISAATRKLLVRRDVPSPREFRRLGERTIVPEYRAQIRELRMVQAPDDKKNAYSAWLEDSDALADDLRSHPALIIQEPKMLADVNDQADSLGLSTQCHIGPS